MGYTHYWTWNKKPSPASVKTAIKEMEEIIEDKLSILAGPDGTGAPEITVDEVSFNGRGEASHETFSFPGTIKGGSGFNFTKTAEKPYDEVVVACLLIAREHFPESVLEIASDGGATDWNKGMELYRRVLGKEPKLPKTVSAPDAEGMSASDAFVQEWGAVSKVGMKPKTRFKEWYQEDAWNSVLTALQERFSISEKDIIYVHFVENTTRRFAYYLMVVFKSGGRYMAGPLFGKYGHAPNMESIESFSDLESAKDFAYDKVATKETKRGYTPVTTFMREQYASVERNAGVLAGLALMLAPFAYMLLRRK